MTRSPITDAQRDRLAQLLKGAVNTLASIATEPDADFPFDLPSMALQLAHEAANIVGPPPPMPEIPAAVTHARSTILTTQSGLSSATAEG